MKVSLVPLSTVNAAWLRAVYPLFIYDLVETGAPYALDDRGVWQPDYLTFWLDPDQPVLVHLIRAEEAYVGFSLVGRDAFPYKSEDADYKISELFLLRRARGSGLARRAVDLLLEGRPGRWELEVLHGNAPACAFWKKVLADRADLEEHPGADDIRFSFTV